MNQLTKQAVLYFQVCFYPIHINHSVQKLMYYKRTFRWNFALEAKTFHSPTPVTFWKSPITSFLPQYIFDKSRVLTLNIIFLLHHLRRNNKLMTFCYILDIPGHDESWGQGSRKVIINHILHQLIKNIYYRVRHIF